MTSDLEVCVTRMAREESESDDDDDDELESNQSEDVRGEVDRLSGGSGWSAEESRYRTDTTTRARLALRGEPPGGS